MKKGQILTGRVVRLDFPNKGIVETAEGNCVVKNTLPGQKVTLMVNKVKHGKPEGRLLSVEEKSALEIPSPCPHFGACGGCNMLTLPYEEQLRIKGEQVKKMLDAVLERQGEHRFEGIEVNSQGEQCFEEIEVDSREACCFEGIKAGLEEAYRFEGIKASPRELAYRNKMEFSFGDEEKGGQLTLGMHKRNSFYDVVTAGKCRIVDEDFRRILRFTRDYFAAAGLPFYHRLKHEGYLRHLLVRKAANTQEILIGLVTTSQESFDLTVWKEGVLELPLAGRIQGILQIVNDSVADVVKSDRTVILYGKDWFYEEILGMRFKISAFSFFQTNSLGAEVLYETVREFVGEVGVTEEIRTDEEILTLEENLAEKISASIISEVKSQISDEKLVGYSVQSCGQSCGRTLISGSGSKAMTEKEMRKPVIFDLYCGTGTIAQMMAPVAAKVIGVEIVPEAVQAAAENAELNGLHNCEFIAGDVLKVLDEIAEKPDFIILDPPRDGVHPKALGKVIGYGVERMVYVSCKPTSLVRDLAELFKAGYGVERAVAVDMFPGTGNVETVVLLSQQNPDDRIEIDLDVGENYNFAKTENSKIPICSQDKEAAIRDVLTLLSQEMKMD